MVAETLPLSIACLRARSLSTIRVGVEEAPVGPAGVVARGKRRLGRLVRVARHEEVAAGARGGTRLAERDEPAHAANLREDLVGLARHQAVGIGERKQQRLAIRVHHRRLGLGIGRLRGEAFLLGEEVEMVHLVPDPRRHGRIGLVARAQLGAEVFHRAQRESGQLLLRAEGDQLAALVHDRDAIARGELEREAARLVERLAGARAQRQGRLAVDRVELLEQRRHEWPIRLEDLHAIVDVELRAVQCGEVRGHLLRRVAALRERQRFDPGLHLLRADLELARRRRAIGRHAQVGGRDGHRGS